MQIPFAASSLLGLGPKKCSTHFTFVNTLHTYIPIVFCFFFINIKKENYKEKKNMHKIGSIKTALHSTALHCTALHCTALHCTAQHCTALHCTVQHSVFIIKTWVKGRKIILTVASNQGCDWLVLKNKTK